MTFFTTKLKQKIRQSAILAVLEAEENFSSGEGARKKQSAIAYVTNALPVPTPIKPLLAWLLTKTIDCAIESVVETIKAKDKEDA